MQVSVVNPDDARPQTQRSVHLLGIDGLGQDVHSQASGFGRQRRILFIIQYRQHQQHRISAEVACGVDLYGVDNKVLAQHRKMRACGDGR